MSPLTQRWRLLYFQGSLGILEINSYDEMRKYTDDSSNGVTTNNEQRIIEKQ